MICFQYLITTALHHQKIENLPERTSNIKPFLDDQLQIIAGIKAWKKFEENNKDIPLNILCVPHNTKTINLVYKSRYNCKRKNQVVLLMITNGKQSDGTNKWHYIALKSVRTDHGFNHAKRRLSRLFKGITSNNNGEFYCLGCLHSFRTNNALKNTKGYVITMIIAMQKCLIMIITH